MDQPTSSPREDQPRSPAAGHARQAGSTHVAKGRLPHPTTPMALAGRGPINEANAALRRSTWCSVWRPGPPNGQPHTVVGCMADTPGVHQPSLGAKSWGPASRGLGCRPVACPALLWVCHATEQECVVCYATPVVADAHPMWHCAIGMGQHRISAAQQVRPTLATDHAQPLATGLGVGLPSDVDVHMAHVCHHIHRPFAHDAAGTPPRMMGPTLLCT